MTRAATCALLALLAACAHVPRVHEKDADKCPPRRVVLVLCIFASCHHFLQPQADETEPDD